MPLNNFFALSIRPRRDRQRSRPAFDLIKFVNSSSVKLSISAILVGTRNIVNLFNDSMNLFTKMVKSKVKFTFLPYQKVGQVGHRNVIFHRKLGQVGHRNVIFHRKLGQVGHRNVILHPKVGQVGHRNVILHSKVG